MGEFAFAATGNTRTHPVNVQHAFLDVGIAGFDTGSLFYEFRAGKWFFRQITGRNLALVATIVLLGPGIVAFDQFFIGDDVLGSPQAGSADHYPVC